MCKRKEDLSSDRSKKEIPVLYVKERRTCPQIGQRKKDLSYMSKKGGPILTVLLGLLGEVMRTCLVSVEDTEDTDEITAVSPSSSSSTSVQKRRMGCKKAVYRQHICKTINWINQVVARKNYPFLYFAQHRSAIFTMFRKAQLSLLCSGQLSYLYFVQ